MATSAVYAGDRTSAGGETEFPADPAAGAFFAIEFRKHEDLKHMLDSNKDGLKLEAMKRIIGMVAKGKDASDLFPAVVKNVVSKNIEVKKLVYVYLVRYAEEQQDLALLSISTFQRALKDPNQLIRASALRVLSSIRVPVIVPIMMLAIKDAVNDMSPYVRKTAAHAIPKLYSLDAEQKDQLIEVIEKLLSDKTTLVMGSAVMAFEEVCPEKIELIHKNYRKLCNLLVDVEEWGQVIIMNMLTRYARTQFANPNEHEGAEIKEEEKAFYESENSESNNEAKGKTTFVMDPDHRLLLRNCKPLLQSRNSSVVISVVQLYYYLAPYSEMNIIAKALIRLIHGHREIQSVVLSNIATLSTKHKGMFEPYIKSFFVRSSDPTHIKILKLEILTNLASESNVSFILREFQTYVSSADMEFVAATIQAIGRCASSIAEVTDTCLNGLVSLLSNRNETVVAESVVVIKKLLQMKITDHQDIIIHMSRLMDNITIPMARASILWLLGEYADKVTKIAPDVLRKVAKNFVNEEEIVKLQAVTLAAKLYLTNPKQTKLLTQYVFNLAKYDQNYDIRDRTRFLRHLTMPQGEKVSQLSKYAKKILLTSKPAPVLQSKFKDRDRFQLGSLSHYINSQASGYHDLPAFPETVPDPTVRNVETQPAWQEHQLVLRKQKPTKKKSFYSTGSSSDASDSSAAEGSDKSKKAETGRKREADDQSSEEEESESSEESDSEESSSEEESSSDGVDKAKPKVAGAKAASKPQKKETTSEETDSDDSDRDETESSSSSEEESDESEKPKAKKVSHIKKVKAEPPKKSVDLLLDLEDFSSDHPVAPAFQPSPFFNVLTPSANINELNEKMTSPTEIITSTVSAAFVPTTKHELLNRYSGKGLSVEYRFTRSPNLYSGKMTTIELTLHNTTQDTIGNVHVPDKKIGNLEVKGFSENLNIAADSTTIATIAIDYNESTQPATFELKNSKHSFSLSIKAPVGEIIQPVLLSEGEFTATQNKLKGMNENSVTIDLPSEQPKLDALVQNVYEVANVMQVQNIQNNPNLARFASITPATRSFVLVTLQILSNAKVIVIVNCDKMVIGSMLLKELKQSLAK